jgi:hypothetical protein
VSIYPVQEKYGDKTENDVLKKLSGLEKLGYKVLHNKKWLQLKEANKKEGELDFLILGPNSFLVLEVKAGNLYEIHNGFIDKGMTGRGRKQITPLKQAEEGANWVGERILNHFGKARKINRGFAALLTQVKIKALNQTAESNSKLLIGAEIWKEKGSYLQEAVLDIMKQWERKYTLEEQVSLKEWEEFIEKELSEVFLYESVMIQSKAIQVSRATRRIHRISRITPAIIADAPLPRVHFNGGPGTGKTLVLSQLAYKYSKCGLNGLFVCYNKLLRDRVKADFVARKISVPVICMEDLEWMLIKIGHNFDAFKKREQEIYKSVQPDAKTRFYSQTLPNAALQVVKNIKGAAEFIIVDEAQDLNNPLWWEILKNFHTDSENGIWAIASDNEQVIHSDPGNEYLERIPENLSLWPLRWNFRNAPGILAAFNENKDWDMKSAIKITASEYTERSFEYEKVKSETDLKKSIGKLIKETLPACGLDLKDLVIIAPYRYDNIDHCIFQRLNCFEGNGWRVTGSEVRQGNTIPYYTIHRFKGLDAPAVLLIDFYNRNKSGQNNLKEKKRLEHLFKVAASRAMVYCLELRG